MKINSKNVLPQWGSKQLRTLMKTFFFLCFATAFSFSPNNTFSQNAKINIRKDKVITVPEMFDFVKQQTGYNFVFSDDLVPNAPIVKLKKGTIRVKRLLQEGLDPINCTFEFVGDKTIIVTKKEVIVPVSAMVQQMISGTVTDEFGQPMPGASIVEKGTVNGTQTDFDGNFTLEVADQNAVLVISYVGFATKEVAVDGQTSIAVTLVEDSAELDEVILVGYGTQRKSDLTGSVLRADIESFENQPNVSLVQSLQGTVPGLNVGQVNSAGGSPSLSVRGRTSISGQQEPLIVLDGAIYRGSIVDINPSDIASVDVLKDASASAVYGSQAANGVILITSKSGKGPEELVFNFRSSITIQSPIRDIPAGSPQEYVNQFINGEILQSRLAPDFLQPNPDYDFTDSFKTNDMKQAFQDNRTTDWHDLLTNDNPILSNHNLSMAYNGATTSSFMSVGFTDQEGYHIGEDYRRWNARLNLENRFGDWLTLGVQSFLTSSDFSGLDIDRNLRYLSPYAVARLPNGELNPQPGGQFINPLNDVINADHEDFRLNLFGNIFAKIDFPFLEGLSYKINYTTNYRNDRENIFRPFAANFQGSGSKENVNTRSYSSDNILTYTNTFADKHNVNMTLLYGFEKRKGDGTYSLATNFADPTLGFNGLEVGQSDLQSVSSSAFEESSLYSMARLAYNFSQKYFLAATVRRDGFSGFGQDNKFGTFPSVSLAWTVSQEKFMNEASWLPYLKLRGSYGESGNRTITRYQTLARVNGGFNYVDAGGRPLYSQGVEVLANNNLKWETTTGLNVGLDFGLFNSKISGSIDYYKNNTKDLLYTVRIPEITGFSTLPVNLGELGNSGIDITLTSTNVDTGDFRWTSTFNFSRNRDELISLLGADIDGDGVEDDLISDELFIGESLNSVFDLRITGELFQIGEDIPSGFDVGVFKIQDTDGVDGITPDDRTILGSTDPDFRFSIQNQFNYKNWNLMVFLNSIQGGKNRYLGIDDLLGWNAGQATFDRNLPAGVDYWTPENPNARYQKLVINVADGLQGRRYVPRNFVRLQDVTLGYDFNPELLKKIHLSRLRLFFSGKNLVTWTKYNGWDPELESNPDANVIADDERINFAQGINSGELVRTGFSRNGRPVLKSYSLGLNVEF